MALPLRLAVFGNGIGTRTLSKSARARIAAAQRARWAKFRATAVGVLLGNGDGTFRPAVTYETNGYLSSSVALGDLNGDGKLDLVVVNQCGAVPIDSDYKCPYATVDVMFGNSDGTFGPPFSDTLNGWKPVSVAGAKAAPQTSPLGGLRKTRLRA